MWMLFVHTEHYPSRLALDLGLAIVRARDFYDADNYDMIVRNVDSITETLVFEILDKGHRSVARIQFCLSSNGFGAFEDFDT
jgi:hypothetical protein